MTFGCSDVYYWMGRTAKAIYFRTADVLALKSHNLDATTLVRAPNFGDPAHRHRRFCASSSRAVRGNTAEVALSRPVVSAMALVVGRRRHLAIG